MKVPPPPRHPETAKALLITMRRAAKKMGTETAVTVSDPSKPDTETKLH